jgi:ABC-type Zn uptake system ZnuABC Zn-binding protein ZnuA
MQSSSLAGDKVRFVGRAARVFQEVCMSRWGIYCYGLMLIALLAGCGGAPAAAVNRGDGVLAVESILADMTRNVVGDKVNVSSLVPAGLDPHAFEPTPKEVARIADSRILIVNGAGLESWLKPVLENAGGTHTIITAADGLASRGAKPGEMEQEVPGGQDPHYWLDPIEAIKYVENIRAGLSKADPQNADAYARNAQAYIAKLQELDQWIRGQIDTIPPEKRLLVTNHETFGYFADRYGFKIVGTVIPNFSSEASPSAQDLTRLSQKIRSTGASAIFLEAGSNPQIANQIAAETGVKVVTDLYTHSLSGPDGPAPAYIDMMRYNVEQIVAALK